MSTKPLDHPFKYAYIGLGLRDDATIRCDGGKWTCNYLDIDGRLYMRVTIDPQGVLLEDYRIDGSPGAMTGSRTLTEAVALHSMVSIGHEPSEFKTRLMLQTPAPTTWVPLLNDFGIGFAPAIALATVRVPLSPELRWRQVEPGPLATRLGISFEEEFLFKGGSPAVLIKSYEGWNEVITDSIVVVRIRVPAIVVPELMTKMYERGRPRTYLERPYVDLQCTDSLTACWIAPPFDDPRVKARMLSYTISEVRGADNFRERSVCIPLR